MKKHWSEKLVALNACTDAVAWARKQASAAIAWKECRHGDWMLWLIGRTEAGEPWSDARKPLVACAASFPHSPPPIAREP